MALSILSFGIFTALAFWITARNLEFASGSGPPSFTAITMSFPILVKALDMADQRFIFLAFLNSKALPIFLTALNYSFGSINLCGDQLKRLKDKKIQNPKSKFRNQSSCILEFGI